MAVRTIAWEGELPGHVLLLEQTKLPLEHVDVVVRSVEEMADAITRLAVRGAPAIGVAAAYGVVLGAQAVQGLRGEDALARILADADRLAASRPTAVNLFWALDRMRARARAARLTGADGAALAAALLCEARAIHREDAEQCAR